MADDCSDIYRGACICGTGEYVMEWCIPDHAYTRKSDGRYCPEITCVECESKYDLIRFANHIVRVPKRYAELSIATVLEVLCKDPFASRGVPPDNVAIITERQQLGPLA